MDKKTEALKLALEALEYISSHYMSLPKIGCMALAAVEEALAEQPAQKTCLVGNEPCKHGSWCSEMYCQEHCKFVEQPAQQEPEFIKHEVENPDDWSDWVCPDPKSYLMKCCDCGLVHEAQFKVVRYKSEDEREECDTVDDPNVQAVFRMRRSEQWSPKDTAYRPGGLAQPEQDYLAGVPPMLPQMRDGETIVVSEQEPVASKQTFTRAEVIRAIEAERHACSIAVWMTLMEATEPDADDKGLAGWMTEAEQRIKNRSANDPEAAQQQEPVQETAWQALPAGPIKVLHQCRAAFIGPVADGLARRCAVAAIDAELARPAQQQEPVANISTWHKNGEQHAELWNWGRGIETLPDGEHDLYTSPPASKPWVGLTEQEHTDIAIQCGCMSADWVFYGATIERILKEKNS